MFKLIYFSAIWWFSVDSVYLGWTSASCACMGSGGASTSCWIVWPQIWRCVCGMYLLNVQQLFYNFTDLDPRHPGWM